jgi:molybdopterin-containing oxidoreductase family iron-sulfur binding subunit
LESWNDFEAVSGHFSVQQPTIHPLFDTRQAQETLMVWAGQAQRSDKNNTAYREFMKARWVNVFNPLGKSWDGFLYEGCWQAAPAVDATATPVSPEGGLTASAASAALAVKAPQGYEVVLYEKVGMGWGNHANNPILQELPDPISRVTWDNYITMAPADMDAMKLNKMMGQEQQANVVKVSLGNRSLELPVLAQPGQAPGSIGIALGYGRLFGRAEQATLGANAFPFMGTQNGVLSAIAYGAKIDTTASTYGLAGTQTHHTMMGRDIIKETSLKEFKANAASGNAPKTQHTNVADLIPAGEHEAPISKVDYWREFKMINHRWGMSIDLNSCTGCGACVVSCHVENNVPVVGKDEVRRSRDMHWLRIDRYYTSDADPSTRYERGNKDHVAKEIPSANPRVAFQPVMCQHCNHAPCETVCPVLATTHSTEGLNQMTYNRCVGTRYCANNCPYKVRRFNWFSYHDNQKFDYFMNDDLGKMVLNPDVTVRARGVMEKCSLCVQRIQAGKLTAKSEGRMVADGEVQTACAEACPTNAIVFGDFNDEKGKLTGLAQHGRSYYLLEEVGVKPNIVYQTKVRNVDEAYGHKAAAHHGAEHTGHDAGHEKGHEVGKEAHSGSANESHSEHKSH